MPITYCGGCHKPCSSLLFTVAYIATHTMQTRYYLFPAAVYAVAVVVFCVIVSENTRVQDSPPLALPRRVTAAVAVLVVAGVVMHRLVMPLSPRYARM